ncbi:MAG: substrate-binding domain-containing protein [Candidatus Bathyarchaeota archaeon]|nr:substrate-binding domain-containing protein [Candidatus Bathyarchaeota archaeon]
MQTWQKLLLVAVLSTILFVSSALVYFHHFVKRRLIISTTTSLYDTGLLDIIEKNYEASHNVDVNIISVGTGMAIQHAQNGDADVILVHSPSMEQTFLEQGYGENRKIFAYNFFTIVGPTADPAGISGRPVKEALHCIVNYGRNLTDQSGQTKIWVSRSDNSGTHLKEQALWQAAGYNYTSVSTEPWFACVGSGMGDTLNVANQKSAYTLSDLGSYLTFRRGNAASLSALITEEQELLNVYSVMAVRSSVSGNQSVHEQVNYEDAMSFIKYLVSPETQQMITDYGKETCGQSLFFGAVQPLTTNSPHPVVDWIKSYAFFDGSECPPQYRNGYPELYP